VLDCAAHSASSAMSITITSASTTKSQRLQGLAGVGLPAFQLALLLAHNGTMVSRLSLRFPTDASPLAPSLPVAARWFALLLALGLLALLGIAASLTPNEQGLGTHRQLGFPQCTALKLLHIRCPVCGMTTAWAHTVRGQLWQAAQANCGGMLLAVLAILAAPWLLAGAVRGRWPGGALSPRVAITLMLCVAGVTVLDWSLRLLSRS
jgi:hypothetical protein